MHHIPRQPAPRLQEDKTSGLGVQFDYFDANQVYTNKKTTSGASGPPAGGPISPTARGAGRHHDPSAYFTPCSALIPGGVTPIAFVPLYTILRHSSLRVPRACYLRKHDRAPDYLRERALRSPDSSEIKLEGGKGGPCVRDYAALRPSNPKGYPKNVAECGSPVREGRLRQQYCGTHTDVRC